ncbi:MAG: excinuclease ABC subunit C [Mycoplasmoidaceae bacterium]|nr:MAG: excinuclease ABC subunit C [Mycoplasmoidaceae bacterium]
MVESLKYKLEKIPHLPGVYMWKDKFGTIIYIGKAKDLFNRVHQYFNTDINIKTKELVENIYDMDFTITKNPNDALILEANLIKQYKPKFNILLRDNNNYPYIVLTNEKDPKLIYTRNYKKTTGTYFGPLADVDIKKFDIFNLLQRIFPLRKCNKVPKTKCLYYDMGMCLGPCINNIEQKQYDNIIKNINAFFKGNNKALINELKCKEKTEADELNFELAKKYMDSINSIKKIEDNKVNVILSNKEKTDVIGYYCEKNYITIIIHSYIKGKLLEVNKQINNLYDDVESALSSFLSQYYLDNLNKPKNILIDTKIDLPIELKVIQPERGEKKQLTNNANLNAKHFFSTNLLVYLRMKQQTVDAFEQLKAVLKIENLSLIHVFDMSNLFDKDRIGVMIGVEDGQFNKKLYRKFIIKNQESHGDTQFMYEVIFRQYSRTIKEGHAFPNLIIVDGAIGQINSARKALAELKIDKIIPVIGLSKDNKHKTDAIVIDKDMIMPLDKKSGLFNYLFNIQEEVHRFAIGFNVNRRKIK